MCQSQVYVKCSSPVPLILACCTELQLACILSLVLQAPVVMRTCKAGLRKLGQCANSWIGLPTLVVLIEYHYSGARIGVLNFAELQSPAHLQSHMQQSTCVRPFGIDADLTSFAQVVSLSL